MSLFVHELMSGHYGHSPYGRHLAELRDTFRVWRQRHAEREELSHLPDRVLHDIGKARGDVEFEAGKHFWQA